MFTDSFDGMSIFDKASTIALYLTLALVVFIFIIGVLVKKFRPGATKTFTDVTIGVAVGYSLGLIGLLLYLKLDRYIADGYIDNAVFIPVVCLLCIAIIFAVCGLITSIFKPTLFKIFTKIAISVLGCFLLAILIAHTVLRYKNNPPSSVSDEILLYVFSAIIIAAVFSIAFIFGEKNAGGRTKSLVFAAVCIATSFALSYIRFLELPRGGSVTLASLVPLMIFSCLFGIRKGLLAGMLYGFLQFIQSPWFLHPVQFLLDYPIAFGAIGLAGIFYERKIFEGKRVLRFVSGALLAAILRYFSHVVSGIFVFGSGNPDYGVIAWSFIYNTFTFVDIAVAIAAGSVMLASKSFTGYLKRVAEIQENN